MPFYLRAKPRPPLWVPAGWAAAGMLIWALAQAWLSRRQPSTALLGGLGQALYVVFLTLLAGAVVGAAYWALGAPRFRESFPLRLLTATVGVAVIVTGLTLASGLASPAGPWPRVTRSEFALSTALLSLVFGWFIARDPFGIAGSTERVYLTPKDVAGLTEAERARLQVDTAKANDSAG